MMAGNVMILKNLKSGLTRMERIGSKLYEAYTSLPNRMIEVVEKKNRYNITN